MPYAITPNSYGLGAGETGLVVNSVDYAAAILARNPLAYWRLGDLNLAAPMLDSSPNHYDGAYTGLINFLQPSLVNHGQGNKSIFVQSGGRGLSPLGLQWNTTAITLIIWFQTNMTIAGSLIDRHRLSINRGWQFRMDGNGKIESFLVSAGAPLGGRPVSALSYDDNQIHMAAWTYDPALPTNQMRIYVDPVVIAGVVPPAAVAINANAIPTIAGVPGNDIHVGCSLSTGGDNPIVPFSGSLDEAAMWGTALDPVIDLAALYAIGKAA